MRNILITGGTRGIGRACAEKFAAGGERVFVLYKSSTEAAEELRKELGIMPFKADVCDKAAVEEAIGEITERFGGIDVLINNAGASKIQVFQDITPADRQRLLGTNLDALFTVTQAVIPGMLAKKQGSIVNIASIWGVSGASCEVLYSASKAGVIGFTQALARELAPSGIRVNSVSPGMIDTDMNSELTEKEKAAFAEEIPLGRIGKPSEIAEAVYFLASPAASYITGQNLLADGGLLN